MRRCIVRQFAVGGQWELVCFGCGGSPCTCPRCDFATLVASTKRSLRDVTLWTNVQRVRVPWRACQNLSSDWPVPTETPLNARRPGDPTRGNERLRGWGRLLRTERSRGGGAATFGTAHGGLWDHRRPVEPLLPPAGRSLPLRPGAASGLSSGKPSKRPQVQRSMPWAVGW
jgi:hypothetical protein